MSVVTALEWLDRFVILIGTVMTAFFVITVQKSQLLHPNLRYYLCQIVIPLNLVGVSRLFADLADELGVFHFSGIYCIVVSTFNILVTGMGDCVMLGIISERFIATYNRGHYEKRSTKWAKFYSALIILYGGFYILICHEFSYSLHAVFPDQCMLIDMYPVLDALGFFICGITVMLCAPPALYLYLYNRNLINENFAVLITFIPVFVVCFIILGNAGFWTIQIAAVLSEGHNWREHVDTIKILVKVSHIAVDLVCIGFEATFVVNHPVLRNKARTMLSTIIPQRIHPNKGSIYIIKTRNGKQIYLSADADEYFKQLEKTWKIQKY